MVTFQMQISDADFLGGTLFTLSSNVADILEAGWVNFSYTYTHAITKRLQIKTPGFPKKPSFFKFYVFIGFGFFW